MAEKAYDLEERTAVFGENVIDFVKGLPHDRINNELVKQIVRSSTSIGANYMEADGAASKKDFKYKLSICRKEAKEKKHWLRMIARANPEKNGSCKKLWQEAQELTLIFSAIIKSNEEKDGNS